MAFLPMSLEEAKERGWDQFDFVYVSGDAYVDHPSFGAAIICRVLENKGYRVGIIAQPDWKDANSFTRLGEPRLAFLVSAGNIDSMVNHYTVAKKRRQKDFYSPGAQMGLRPDRATIVYANKIRETYKKTPILIGGIEASLRRLAHYDYWENKVRRSILLDSGADLLLYGMGERTIVAVAEALESGIPVQELTFLRGTVYKTKDLDRVYDAVTLPHYREVSTDKEQFSKSYLIQYRNTDAILGKPLLEPYDEWFVVQNPPAEPLSTEELDAVYALPYMRDFHPSYLEQGGIPAITEVKYSLISNRGCFGSCSFCALTFHQGRIVTARSHDSIVAEAKKMTEEKDFKGYIHDVGGPTANFRGPACKKQQSYGACPDRQCLFPTPCKNLNIDHKDYIVLLRKLRLLPGVKKVFIRSGIRYDYLIHDPDDTFFKELCQYHISGQLKVAPEHVSPTVLEKMGKPTRQVYDRFVQKFNETNRRLGMNQYLVPYLMSSHPGSDLEAAIALAEYLRDIGHNPEQVQDFYPTPGTLSTCMYYTEKDPRTNGRVFVPKTPHEKAIQRALMQYRLPQNYELVREGLLRAHRNDLIGYGNRCLIRPDRTEAWRTKSDNGKTETKPKISYHKKWKVSDKTKPMDKSGIKKKKTIRTIHKKK